MAVSPGDVAQRGELGLDAVEPRTVGRRVGDVDGVGGGPAARLWCRPWWTGWGEKLSQTIAIRTSAGSRPFIKIPSDGPGRSLQQIAGNLLGGVGEAGSSGLQVDAGCPSGAADRVVPPAQQESVE